MLSIAMLHVLHITRAEAETLMLAPPWRHKLELLNNFYPVVPYRNFVRYNKIIAVEYQSDR